MKILQQLAKTFSLTRSTPTDLSPALQSWIRGGDDEDIHATTLTSPYSQSAWIYVAVSVLGETIASIPFRITRGSGKSRKLVESGPVYELFQNPHPSMSPRLVLANHRFLGRSSRRIFRCAT